jgi:TonB-dependent starch-binding outer membrane protein SusC
MNGQMQKLFRMFLVSILMLLFTFTVNAQEQTITGKVYDVAGEPIIGANVLIQGTTQGVITDMEGAFRLKADPSQSLVISFLSIHNI